MLDALSQHHLVEDLATSLSNKSVQLVASARHGIRWLVAFSGIGILRLVHFTPPRVDERLDMVAVLVLDVEIGARHGTDLTVESGLSVQLIFS